MYLLQTSEYGPAIMFLAGGIGLAITYWIIKAAVQVGTRDLRKLLHLQNNLKIMELQEKGMPREYMKQAYDDSFKMQTSTYKQKEKVINS